MDWKKKMEEMKEKSAAGMGELKAKLDKDGDGVPDAAEAAMAKAREAAAAANAKLAELKSKIDKDADGTPDAVEKLSEQTKQALEAAKAKAAQFSKAAQEKLGKKPTEGTPPENA